MSKNWFKVVFQALACCYSLSIQGVPSSVANTGFILQYNAGWDSPHLDANGVTLAHVSEPGLLWPGESQHH